MASISYLKAATSCLPFIGPLVNLCDLRGVQETVHSELESLTRIESSTREYRNLTQFVQGQNNVRPMDENANRLIELTNESLAYAEQNSTYIICGIVGNILSVAVLIGLIACGILNSTYLLILGACLTFRIAVLVARLQSFDKITELANQFMNRLNTISRPV